MPVIAAIDSFLLRWQKGERPQINEEDDLCFTLGSLWGEQIAKEFGWHWAGVRFQDHDDMKAVAIVSPDCALTVFPFEFIHGCIVNNATVTILLAYNMLKDGSKIPSFPSGAYVNVMDYVHYIIPR